VQAIIAIKALEPFGGQAMGWHITSIILPGIITIA
jgi:hypothetical protein